METVSPASSWGAAMQGLHRWRVAHPKDQNRGGLGSQTGRGKNIKAALSTMTA